MLNLDTRIPLMVQERGYGRGFDTMQQAQMNQLKLQALRDEYNAAKEERDRQKAIRQGMAIESQKMQQGTPAQYRTTFPQTIPTGQMPRQTMPPVRMPSGMTGVLASERGQKLPQPALLLVKTSYKAILTLIANWLVLRLHQSNPILKMF